MERRITWGHAAAGRRKTADSRRNAVSRRVSTRRVLPRVIASCKASTRVAHQQSDRLKLCRCGAV